MSNTKLCSIKSLLNSMFLFTTWIIQLDTHSIIRYGLSNWLFWSVLINEFCSCLGNELRHLLGSLRLSYSLFLALSEIWDIDYMSGKLRVLCSFSLAAVLFSGYRLKSVPGGFPQLLLLLMMVVVFPYCNPPGGGFPVFRRADSRAACHSHWLQGCHTAALFIILNKFTP